MTVSELISKLDHFFKEPDGVQKFRRLVVDLAIRGAFTSKEDQDQCSENLLRRVQAEKQKYLKKTSAPPPAITSEELPLNQASVPFVRLEDIARIEKGETGIQKAEPGEYPLVSLAVERATCSTYQIDAKAAIVPLISSTGHGHASMRRLHYQEGKFALANILCAVIPFVPDAVSARFIFEYLSAYKEPLLVSKMIGTANVSLTIGKIAATPFPAVCSEAQHLVEELMILCDKYEMEQAKSEKRRDKLVTASLHRVSNATADLSSLQECARFYFKHLPCLTTRSEHIDQLRQSILDLAVRGMLVPQDPKEEPAPDLAARIDSIRRGRHRRNIFESKDASRERNDTPFHIPKTWAWRRAGDIYDIRDGTHATPKYVDKGIPLVTSKNLRSGTLDISDVKLISEADHEEISRRSLVEKGDILFAMIGTIGNPVLVQGNLPFSIKNVALYKYYSPQDSCPAFLKYLLRHLTPYMQVRAAGGLQPFVSLKFLRELPLPIPPLSEQVRIVAKLDQLMALLDNLTEQLQLSNCQRLAFLDATLQQPLALSELNPIPS